MTETEAWEERMSRQIAAYHESALLYAAVTLGLPDLLAADARTAEQLAADLGLSAPHLHRVLRGLVRIGVCEERPGRTFALTQGGQSLRSGTRLNEKVQIVVGQYWQPWAALASCLKSGKPAFDQVFGMSVRDWRKRNAEQGALFDSYLARETPGQSDLIAEALELSEVKSIVNVDGQDAIQSDAEIYVMNRVLQTLDDEEAHAILTNCRKAMPDAAKLLIIERLMPEEASSDAGAVMLDLHMMVITGGRLRTLAEMRALLAQAGLTLAKVSSIKDGLTMLTAGGVK
jgi:orsellinic acid C2-O-methyltransferase